MRSWRDLNCSRNRIPWNPKFHYCITRARHVSLSWARSILTMPPHANYKISILIISSHQRLCLPSGLFPSGLLIKTLHFHRLSPTRATCPAEIHRDRELRNAQKSQIGRNTRMYEDDMEENVMVSIGALWHRVTCEHDIWFWVWRIYRPVNRTLASKDKHSSET